MTIVLAGSPVDIELHRAREERARALHTDGIRRQVQDIVGRRVVVDCQKDPSDGMYIATARGEQAKSATEVGALRKLWNKLRRKIGPESYASVTNHTHDVLDRGPSCPACGKR